MPSEVLTQFDRSQRLPNVAGRAHAFLPGHVALHRLAEIRSERMPGSHRHPGGDASGKQADGEFSCQRKKVSQLLLKGGRPLPALMNRRSSMMRQEFDSL